MSDQMINEIYQWEKTLELDNKEIDYTLKQTLAYTGIQTPYEFAIIKNGIVQDGTFKKSQKNDFLKSKYKVRLFPDNIIKTGSYSFCNFSGTDKLCSWINGLDTWRFTAFLSFHTGNICLESLFYHKAEKNLGDEIRFHK